MDDRALWWGAPAAARPALISDFELRNRKRSFVFLSRTRGIHNLGMKKELESRTKKIAIRIIKLSEALPRRRTADVLGRQVLRSGTSIGANYREANRAQFREDFIHKVALCEKESAETEYWLELLVEAKLITAGRLNPLIKECRELLAIFVTSGRTAKRRLA